MNGLIYRNAFPAISIKPFYNLPVAFPALIRQWISTNNGPLLCGSILTTNFAFSLVTGFDISSDARNISPKLPLPIGSNRNVRTIKSYTIINMENQLISVESIELIKTYRLACHNAIFSHTNRLKQRHPQDRWLMNKWHRRLNPLKLIYLDARLYDRRMVVDVTIQFYAFY